MSQSRKHSVLEKSVDLSSGFLISFLVWEFILKNLITNHYLSIDNTFTITIIFTIISFIRGYFWRRYFNDRREYK